MKILFLGDIVGISGRSMVLKNLLSNIAIKLIESNFSNESLQVCGSILKQSFMEQGFDRATSNEFAVDALKITMQTLSTLK